MADRTRGHGIARRRFLEIAGTAMAWAPFASLSGGCATPPRFADTHRSAAFLVPGYRSDLARFRSGSARDADGLRGELPVAWHGPVTMLTRLDERGGVLRRLLPIDGHAVSVHPDGRSAFWASLNGETLVGFEPETLGLTRLIQPEAGYVSGGHAVYTQGGSELISAERRRHGPFAGSKQAHHGLLTVRDADSLAVLEHLDSHGINPHEVNLTADGRHVAVAHYGNTRLPGPNDRYQIVESSFAVLELATGKLVYKHVEPDRRFQVRHLAAHRLDRLMAILVHNVPPADVPGFFDDRAEVYEPDLTTDAGNDYFPAPLMRHDADARNAAALTVWPDDPSLLRQGQSIVYDPVHDQMIATFASSHCVLVVSGATGRVEQVIRTDRLGLRYPRGLDLHPDGAHYAVAGSWRDLLVFRRGDHRPVPERSQHVVFFDHSHLTAYARPEGSA